MTRLILDYYRRWSLVLSLGMALQLLQGWWIAADPRTPIEFTGSMIPICLGLVLPLLDLSQGVVRVVGTLPVNLAKIGRGWWLANVLIPAIILVALLFLGAGAALFCHPDRAFPLHRLAMSSLLTMLWLGTIFFLVIPATGKVGNIWRPVPTMLVAILTVFFIFWMIFGFVLSPGAANNPIKLAIFLVGGIYLTIAGWFRAVRFDSARVPFACPNTGLAAKFYMHKASAARFRFTRSTNPRQPPEGRGGILFLLRATFMHGLFVYFAGAILILFLAWVGPRFPAWQLSINLREGFKTSNPSVTVLLTFILCQRLPFLMQLRLLRTLPISTVKLAVVILTSVMVPVIAAGLLMAGVAGLSVGTPAAWTVLKSGLLILAPIALCIFVTVWRGGGIQAYAFCFVAMMSWVLVIAAWQNVTFPLAGGVAVAGLILAWLLTYYALSRGRHAYRARSHPSGSFVWTAAR